MPRNRRFATVEKSYITDIERERCKKVAAAYAELYELESILVLDVGRYGFVKLQYYTPEYGFFYSPCMFYGAYTHHIIICFMHLEYKCGKELSV